MLDGADAGPDGVLDPRRALRVGHHRAALHFRFRHQDLQLFRGELRMPGIIAWREHAAGRAHLEHVGPRAQQRPRDAAHLVGTVRQRRRTSGMRQRQRNAVPGRQPAVAVATGLADQADRDLQAWPRNQPVVDRLLDAEIRARGVPHRGDAEPERGPKVPRRLVELV